MYQSYSKVWAAVAVGLLCLSGCDLDFQSQKSPAQDSDHQSCTSCQVPEPTKSLYGQGSDYKARTLQDEIFYHVFLDRFANGDVANDDGEVGTLYSGNLDPTQPHFYHGGDLIGVTQKLDYLAGMGITALWLSPVYKGIASVGGLPNYHGYMISDFMNVDPHLGGNQALKDLVAAAHARGMKIYLDVVVAQTTNAITYEGCGDSCRFRELDEEPYTPLLIEGLETIKNPAWLNDPQYYHNRGTSYHAGDSRIYGDFITLDALKTTDTFVQQGMIDIHKYWIQEFDIDGFRLDTVPYNPVDFWAKFSAQIHQFAREQGNPNFAFFGEVAYEPAAKAGPYSREGGLDSTLDFNVYGALAQVFSRGDAPVNLARVFERDDYYNDADSSALNQVNFASNHDFGRFGAQLRLDNPNASEDELLQRYQQALAFLFFARGVPLIYYGDEQGFVGANLSDTGEARQDMFPTQVAAQQTQDLIGSTQTPSDDNFNPQHPLYQHIQAYSALYKKYSTLRSGQQWVLSADETQAGALVMARVSPNEGIEYVIAFNTSAQPLTLTTTALTHSADFKALYPTRLPAMASDANGQLSLSLAPFAVQIYQAQSSMALPTLAPQIELSLEEGSKVEQTLEVAAQVSVPSLAKVTFAYATQEGNWVPFSEDWTAPYTGYLDTHLFTHGQTVKLQATVTDRAGQTQSVSRSVVIAHQGVDELTLHYENQHQQQQVLVMNELGDVSGPYALTDNQMTLPLKPTTRSLFLVFETREDFAFSYDVPVSVAIKDLEVQDLGDGRYGAQIYINNAAQWSAQENYALGDDKARLAGEDVLQGDGVYLRGSMNTWASDDRFNYVGNGTYQQTLLLTKGHHEYNFQTNQHGFWKAPVTDAGLNDEGYNAHVHVAKTAYYDVFYSQLSDGQKDYRFYQFSPSNNLPEFFTVPVYLRGINGDWGTGDALQLTQQGGNLYSVDLPVDLGLQVFKLASSDWSTQYGVAELAVGASTPIYPSCCVGDDLTFNVDEAGTYRFTADMSDLEQPKMKVELLSE